MASARTRAPSGAIESKILLIRGRKVILDRDLAGMYGVTTGSLNQAVRRNLDRFPEDFMLLLTRGEVANLISQSVISSWGGTRKPPRAFTEQGVAMLSGVLRGKRAARVNIEIMRAFVRLRQVLASHRGLAGKMALLADRVDGHDESIRSLAQALHKLLEPPASGGRARIGFRTTPTSRTPPARGTARRARCSS
ncbi:MAG: ORF6N domain-containing protein [Planctomycetes bacterium]|nr:ORF6N domain-containing protein [Planctomycetota bacterium]